MSAYYDYTDSQQPIALSKNSLGYYVLDLTGITTCNIFKIYETDLSSTATLNLSIPDETGSTNTEVDSLENLRKLGGKIISVTANEFIITIIE